MKWFFEKYVLESAKNGSIGVRRRLGEGYVSVAQTGQTSAYTHEMWVDAFGHITKQERLATQSVLMLGLGAGGEIKTIYKNFPGCKLTVVEHDPVMIALAKKLKLYRPYALPAIVEGDAKEVLLQLSEQFNLIIVDLFLGEEPSQLLADRSFVGALASRLAPRGLILINAYKRALYLEALAPQFEKTLRWTFRLNNLGLFREPKVYYSSSASRL